MNKNKYICMISNFRKEKKITQESLAKQLGISRKTLSQIENGSDPGLFNAYEISNILKVPIEILWYKKNLN